MSKTSILILDSRDALNPKRRRREPGHHLISIVNSKLIKQNVLSDLAKAQNISIASAGKCAELSKNILISRMPDNTWEISCKNTNPKLCQEILALYIKNIVKISESLEVEIEKNVIEVVDKPGEPVRWSTSKERIATGTALSILSAFFITLVLRRLF
ncbi:MAG: hypothetical protein EXS67_03100 [Candidatus Margulisbacteria bacterium]|nr:hypothetical protein [Candidatus Margulisiibacteriota bacterium]